MEKKANLDTQNFSEENDKELKVIFARSGLTANWCPSYENLLDFAEAQGLNPDYSCREGACETCACQLIKGEIEYREEPVTMPEDDKILICCTVPKTNIIINL